MRHTHFLAQVAYTTDLSHPNTSVNRTPVISCYECNLLVRCIPALTEIEPEISVVIISGGDYAEARKLSNSNNIKYIADLAIVRELKFKVAPYGVFLQGNTPQRKGIVNSLEQMRLLIDPSCIEKIEGAA